MKLTEKRFNARKNTDNDFEKRLEVQLEDILGIVKTDEVTDSVELKKEYYQGQSKDKHYTYLDYSKTKFIGSFYCNDEFGEKPLINEEVCDLLNENEQLKKQRQELYHDIAKLFKENEQLKKDVECWKQVASQYSNEFNVNNSTKSRNNKEKNCGYCKNYNLDGMFGIWCSIHETPTSDKYCQDFEWNR